MLGQIKEWFFYIQVSGPQIRTLIGLQSLTLGLAYLLIQLGIYAKFVPPTIYALQQALAPIWVYSLLFLVLGITTLSSNKTRTTYNSRKIAVCGASVFTLYALTFMPSGALTAAVYLITAYAYYCEAMTDF